MRVDKIKIITKMAKMDITQKELAEKSQLARGTINAIARGKSCSNETAQKIAKALNVSIDEILED